MSTLRIFISVLLYLHISTYCTSFKDYIPFLKAKKQHETFTKEYDIASESIITIKGSSVDVSCSSWHEKKVLVIARKEVSEKESLNALHITDFITPHSLTLSVQEKDPVTQGYCSIEMKIPQHASLTIQTEKGTITTKGPIDGKIHAQTDYGNIHLEQTHNHVVAQSSKAGNIVIDQAHAPLKALTHKGNITITQSRDSVFAQATQGSISLKAYMVPSHATIKAHSVTGLIAIELPRDINADLQAFAKKGTITCQHPVTLKPRTTTLDQKAWRTFKEQVDGILGSGDASIVLHTERGNIKILNTHAVTT